jgi:hypothetical protein
MAAMVLYAPTFDTMRNLLSREAVFARERDFCVDPIVEKVQVRHEPKDPRRWSKTWSALTIYRCTLMAREAFSPYSGGVTQPVRVHTLQGYSSTHTCTSDESPLPLFPQE